MKVKKFIDGNLFNIVSAIISIVGLLIAYVALQISKSAARTGASEAKQDTAIEKLTDLSQNAQLQLNTMHSELEELRNLNTSTTRQLQLMIEQKEGQNKKYLLDVEADHQQWLIYVEQIWRAHEDIFHSHKLHSLSTPEDADEYTKFTNNFMDRQIDDANSMYISNKFLAENILLRRACIVYRNTLKEIKRHTAIGAEESKQELIKFTCVSKCFYMHSQDPDANTPHTLLNFEKNIKESMTCVYPGG